MALLKSFFSNTRKPAGTLGRIMARGMNGGSHAKLADWGLSHYSPQGTEKAAADLGCGGGANLLRLSSLLPSAFIAGLDYSPVSVSVSEQTSRELISAGRCRVLLGSVTDLPFADSSQDLLTAFETVYFWPDLPACFSQAFRVLKPGGAFLIVNESDGKHEASLKWTKIIDGMTVYTGSELSSLLKKAGFSAVSVDDDEAKDRLCVLAVK